MISCVILTKNNESYINSTLKSLQSFSEVIILDTGSTDSTLSIAKTYPNVKIFHQKLSGFGPTRNIGATFAFHPWILALDADEVLSPSLAKEIHKLNLSTDTIYKIPFRNYYNNKWIKGCGWYPESHIRLYHKETTSFSDSQVHEKILSKSLSIKKLKHPIHHTSYRSIQDFIDKMDRYSTLFAKQNKGKMQASFKTALFHGIFAFFKSYFLKRGFLMGKEGFIISLYNANTSYFKYLKLMEENRKCS